MSYEQKYPFTWYFLTSSVRQAIRYDRFAKSSTCPDKEHNFQSTEEVLALFKNDHLFFYIFLFGNNVYMQMLHTPRSKSTTSLPIFRNVHQQHKRCKILLWSACKIIYLSWHWTQLSVNWSTGFALELSSFLQFFDNNECLLCQLCQCH